MNGHSIKRLRKILGITQVDFAKTLRITQAHLSYMERGQRGVSQDIINKIKDRHGLTATQFILELEQQIALLRSISG